LNPLVSIIIPTYNRAHLISETLNSIIAQTYTNWECIIVDDGSTDNTEKVLKDYTKKDSRFQYHKRSNERPKGANACRNYGFEVSKGDYIQWFDSDDLMHIDKLKIKVEQLNENRVDFVVCEGVEYNSTIDNIIRKWDKIYSKNVLKDHITGKVIFSTNGPMFLRTFLTDKKLFNENLQRKQEWEYYSRLLTFSTNYKPIHKSLYYIREHIESVNGQNSIKTLKSRIKANQLVFNLVKQNLSKNEILNLRNKFFNKYILFFKIAWNSKKTNLILIITIAIVMHLTPKMFLKKTNKLFKNPKIISNIFK